MESLFFILGLCPSEETLIFEWSNGTKVKGFVDTIFDTTNGLNENDPNFKKIQAITFVVVEIISSQDSTIKEESLIEISKTNPPSFLYSEKNDLIWKN